MSQVRAVRNNNPGNIEAGAGWQGLCPRDKMTPEQAAEKRFAVFETPAWGFRAIAIILLKYEHAHRLSTIRQIISRWAPAGENDTNAYIYAVSRAMGVDPDAPLDLAFPEELAALAKAIATHECGGWLFKDEDLHDGVAMALGPVGLMS